MQCRDVDHADYAASVEFDCNHVAVEINAVNERFGPVDRIDNPAVT